MKGMNQEGGGAVVGDGVMIREGGGAVVGDGVMIREGGGAVVGGRYMLLYFRCPQGIHSSLESVEGKQSGRWL